MAFFYYPYHVVSRVLRLWRNVQGQEHAGFDSLLSRAGLEHLGKGWIVRVTTTRKLPYWSTSSSTRAGTGRCDFKLIVIFVADCQAMT